MRTDTERIVLLHARAQRLEDQKKMRIWGSVSLCLFAVLLAALVQTDVPFLGESAGGYVLVAVISFVAAVCITAYCIRRRKN